PRLLVNVELKSSGLCDASVPALVDGVDQLLRSCGVEGRVLVSSFDPRAVALWQRRRPDVPGALLIDDEGLLAGCKALALPFLRPAAAHPPASLCRGDIVQRLHTAGYAVNTWTVDDPARLRA